MSARVLEVQVSKRRLRAVERAVDPALRRAGAPYRRWAVVVDAPRDGDPYVRVMRRAEAFERIEKDGCLGEFFKRAKAHPREIPEFVFWDGEESAELWWITPPEGTW